MTPHRTTLFREWIGTGGRVNWIMLNPSTADDVFDDPTIRKCVGFSKHWGFSGLVVTNLFSFRATYPADLRAMVQVDYARAVGDNDRHLIEQAAAADLVVAAWGTHGNLAGRAHDVLCRVLPETTLYCISKTKGGFPLHPCMAKYTESTVLYRWADLCSDCPPVGYPTDRTRCSDCPRRADPNEPDSTTGGAA